MIELPKDAPGRAACGRSGLPLLAVCPGGHRRAVPFRLLKTDNDDATPLFGRPFRCPKCSSPEVRLFAFERTSELWAFQQQRDAEEPPPPPRWHSTPGSQPPDPNDGFL